MSQKVPAQVLAYDLGGTKVAVGVVDETGKIIEELRVPVAAERSKNAVLQQLAELGKSFLSRYPKIKHVGIASAGPLHAETGILLDPTNLAGPGKSWGRVPLAAILTRKLGKPVFLENDAAAAALAEHWIGSAKNYDNAMILTLGTGLGTGIIINGELVRSGQGLHPEAGHMIVNFSENAQVCGCGNRGCAEAFLSGGGFTRWMRARLQNTDLTGEQIAEMARNGNSDAQKAFKEYAYIMAVTIHNYVMMYAPEIIVFTGSFAATADLFIPQTKKHLETLLIRHREGIDMFPKLTVSKLRNKAGIIGGAYVALRRRPKKK